MSDVFISYASEDRERAQRIADALTAQGRSTWWDREIPPGRSFDEVIEEAIEASRCVVVLWTRHSVASDWVKNEATEGARRRILVPAMLEEVKLPLAFRHIQAADLRRWDDDPADPEFAKLMAAVRRVLGEPVGPEGEGTRLAGIERRTRWPVRQAAAAVAIGIAAAAALWWATRPAEKPPDLFGGKPPIVTADPPLAAASKPVVAGGAASPLAETRAEADKSLETAVRSLAWARQAAVDAKAEVTQLAGVVPAPGAAVAARARLDAAVQAAAAAASDAGRRVDRLKQELARWPTDDSADARAAALRIAANARLTVDQVQAAQREAEARRADARTAAAQVRGGDGQQARRELCEFTADAQGLSGNARRLSIDGCMRR